MPCRSSVDPTVVDAYKGAVGGEPDVALDGIGPIFDRLQIRGEAVLGLVLISTTMSNHFGEAARDGLAAHGRSLPQSHPRGRLAGREE